ncbi:MAG: hypothetical protein GEU95_10730 [Rhizobiales bacterium]|nr:hypothetical protein [Hyphomicrobiales bacterium]
MPAESLALSTRPPEPAADTDYDAICAAVTATARGRWFLAEFARRNRQNDTVQVLAAIARMEAAVLGEHAQHTMREADQQVRIELLDMARTIAQTRAEITESRPKPSALAIRSRDATDPTIAAAAERLRQIAWTMRACGVEVAASDQIGQIADTIVTADTVHSLGVERSHKLAEVLHYLEHRIERMLDSRLTAANRTEARPAPDTASLQADHNAAGASVASSAPSDVATRLDTELPPSSHAKEAAAAMAAAGTAADAAEFAVDDDVVLTVADDTAEFSPALSVASEPSPTPESIEAKPTSTSDSDVQSSAHSRLQSRSGVNSSGNRGGLSLGWLSASAGTSERLTEAITTSNAIDTSTINVESASAPAAGDAIAMQVDRDLDGLADTAPAQAIPAPAAPAAGSRVTTTQTDNAKLSTALEAIESELRTSVAPPGSRADSPPPLPKAKAKASATAKSTAEVIVDGPLAALMAMSEEERIALFS